MSDPLHPPEDFGEAFDAAAERVRAAVAAACARPAPWPARIRAAIEAILEFAAADPAAGRLLLVEPWAHGAAGMARRGLLLGGFAALLATERRPPPGLSEQILVAAVAGALEHQLRQPGAEVGLPTLGPDLAALAPELVELALVPYVGCEEARRWAAI